MLPIDPTIIREAQRDRTRFAAIYDHYAQPLFRFLYSRVGARPEAEELTAQTFLAALEGLPDYQERGAFGAWLFTIARRKVADHFRRQSRQAAWAADQELENLAAQDPPDQLDLRAALSHLPDAERELLQMRYVAGLSFAEMAALLGRSPDAVKKSLYRLQARLQAQLETRDE